MNRIFMAALAAALVGAACSTLEVSTDYDKSVDFTPVQDVQLARHRRHQGFPLGAADRERALGHARGQGPQEGGQRRRRVARRACPALEADADQHYNSGWGYGYGWYGGGMETSTVSEIPVGTLVVDLVDGKKKDMVWRGIASDTLDPQAARRPARRAAGRRGPDVRELPAEKVDQRAAAESFATRSRTEASSGRGSDRRFAHTAPPRRRSSSGTPRGAPRGIPGRPCARRAPSEGAPPIRRLGPPPRARPQARTRSGPSRASASPRARAPGRPRATASAGP